MKLQGQSIGINTAKVPNNNQNTNKLSGKAAATANRLQNNTNPYPVIFANPISSSVSSQIRLPDNREMTGLTVITEKTVHKKDIIRLNNDVNAGINKIKSTLKIITNDTSLGSLKDEKIKELNRNLSELSDSVQTYKNKYHSTSYIHNSSKLDTLNKLEKKLSVLSVNIQNVKNKNNYFNTRSDQIHNDNYNKAAELRIGKKTPSKFEE
ncbi:TPA: hypothetical protein ACKRTE_002459 [Providencia rettgeri]